MSRAILGAVRFATRPWPAAILLLGLIATFVGIGLGGLDFGGHWDEWYHVAGVQGCVNRLSLLPEPLSYGGPYFTLGFPVVMADQWRNIVGMLHDLRTQPVSVDVSALPAVVAFKAGATALLNTSNYVMRVRSVFLIVTSLSALWAYLAILRCWPRRTGAALAAAAFMALSWELGYHARWIAIDTPLAQFSALELFLFCGAWHARGQSATLRWYCGAAAAAGAVFASKLTGLFAVMPILVTPLVIPGILRWRTRLLRVLLGAAVFFLVSFALSPEFYLDPLHFLNVIRSGSTDYNTTPINNPHYVGNLEHSLRLFLWYIAAFPSPVPAIAMFFSLLGAVGLGDLLRRRTRMTLTWFSFIGLLTVVFARNHLLIVRQYLMIAPFVALCFGRGVAVVWDLLRQRSARVAPVLVVLVCAGFATNIVVESVKAWHVTHDSDDSVSDDAAHDLLTEKEPVRMTHAVFERLKTRIGDAYACRPANVNDASVKHMLIYNADYEWMGNRIRAFRHTYGGAEVNLNFYTAWSGRLRWTRLHDVWMPEMKIVADFMGRDMNKDLDCFPARKDGR
ncbi:MAG TPA: hypothetical protein VHU40_22165 [Polyangia bacterium]|nr:hypothetical protein [Polyangia bacterium]